MKSEANTESDEGTQVVLDIPSEGSQLFRSESYEDILSLLSRYPNEELSISDLAAAVDHSRPTVTKAVDGLRDNNLLTTKREGNKRVVSINTERLFQPTDPILRIPQSEFHDPVRTAVSQLTSELEEVLGIVLYGSVANGTADRRSDIDLWILVRADRMENQRAVNHIREELEGTEFPQGRYEFDIDVEELTAVPNYQDEIQQIITNGRVVYDAPDFEQVRQLILHGETHA